MKIWHEYKNDTCNPEDRRLAATLCGTRQPDAWRWPGETYGRCISCAKERKRLEAQSEKFLQDWIRDNIVNK
jgi:hypothetical protein